MQYEEKTKYLNNYLSLDSYIDILIEEKKKWYDRALKITPTYSDMPKAFGVGESKTEVAIEKVTLIENEINLQIDKMVNTREKITKAISKIDEIILQRILYLKYICGYSFEKIGEEIGYCTKQISRLHKKAIEIIDL